MGRLLRSKTSIYQPRLGWKERHILSSRIRISNTSLKLTFPSDTGHRRLLQVGWCDNCSSRGKRDRVIKWARGDGLLEVSRNRLCALWLWSLSWGDGDSLSIRRYGRWNRKDHRVRLRLVWAGAWNSSEDQSFAPARRIVRWMSCIIPYSQGEVNLEQIWILRVRQRFIQKKL